MAALGILREYAKKSIPSPALPESILFAHTDTTLTIFDAYPKASSISFIVNPTSTLNLRHLGHVSFLDYATASSVDGDSQVLQS
jgi:aprataxin